MPVNDARKDGRAQWAASIDGKIPAAGSSNTSRVASGTASRRARTSARAPSASCESRRATWRRACPSRRKWDGCATTKRLTDFLNYHKANGRDTTKLEAQIRKHLTPFFKGKRIAGITTAQTNAYRAHRMTQERIVPARIKITRKGKVITPERRLPVKPATVNRELAWLKQMFALAVEACKLMTKPRIKLVAEHNVRTGFFEPDDYNVMLSHLPEVLQPPVRFAYLTGWRMNSEVLPLTWKQIDFTAGQVRLEPGTTKNKEGRTFPFTPELRSLLEAQRIHRDQIKKSGKIPTDRVFFRMVANERGGEKHPQPITSLVKAFKAACRKAGCPGRTPHDLRRTAVRDFVRSGVPQTIAMRRTGHKTDSVFRRYDIVSEDDMRVAAQHLARRR